MRGSTDDHTGAIYVRPPPVSPTLPRLVLRRAVSILEHMFCPTTRTHTDSKRPETPAEREVVAYACRVAGISGSGRSELARVTARGRRLVSVGDVSSALEIDHGAAAKRVARWETQGWLRRVRRDLYIPVPVDAENPAAWSEDPLYLADAVWAPCYFTGWTSANHLGLTEQVFRTTVLKTTRRVRRSTQHLLDHEYLLVHVAAESMAWGVTPVWREDRRILIADAARTVIDVLDDPRLAGGIRNAADLVEAYAVEGDLNILIGYGERLGNATVFKRLGFILAAGDLAEGATVEQCRRRISGGISLLDPSAPPTGERVNEWGLRVNVRIDPGGAS